MGVGPLLGSVAIQWYIFVAVSGLIRHITLELTLLPTIDKSIGSSTSIDHPTRLHTRFAYPSQG